MKLQYYTNGAWKDVGQFDASRKDEVVKAAKALGSILGDGTSWCLLHDSGRRERINVFAGGVSRGMELRA